MSFSLRFQLPVRLLVDLLLLGILLVLVENFSHFWPPPTKRGFFCDDESLMYPYHENTVSPALLHWLGLHLPLLFLVVFECLIHRHRIMEDWGRLWPAYNTVRWFLYGYVFNDLLKGIGKHTIGRLRPHFFAVCRPHFPDGSSCSDVQHSGELEYHTDYECRPDLSLASEEMIRDVNVSFPSGHSAMAFYGLVFVALHLRRRRSPLGGSLLGPVLQLACVAVAWFVALSRVMDYKHHWSDVAAGSLLGAGTAFAVVRAAAFEEQQGRCQDSPAQEEGARRQDAAVEGAAVKGGQQVPQDLCLV
ncbi:LOW QUALITY PROTEIN: putative phosphatidate phosphatase [Drosophila ficusphila]|uniref:LOW QUALITY PROTEIN: putative phosphatidate phosphatase n=1 Tax=Drosophila ficusphila TaxID=30025 RepID=UPI0007E6D7EB|nr:LOW QUALITY PROTEIN: putative phosphatidate phosphatase [Drosophila ficusphila]